MKWWLVPLAYFVDLVVGDPQNITHPVIYQGRLIAHLEKKLNNPDYPPLILKILGVLVVAITVGLAYWITWFLIFLAGRVHPICGGLVAIWLTSTTIAQKGLAQAALPIAEALQQRDLALARQLTGEIVGRETTHLDEHEIVRATIETVSENTVDGVTSPLFYAFLGGAPLAMAYRATNTLDSMLGYKTPPYLHFGWAAARLDDLVNYVPARLTALILPLAVRFLELDVLGAIRVMKRDARKHPSPNSGLTEAGFAGAMAITLGGENVYGDRITQRALMGEVWRRLESSHILVAVELMQVVACLFFLVGISILLFLRWI